MTIKATIQKFKEQGEKTGWTYIHISSEDIHTIYPDYKKSFRVKGKIDSFEFKGIALLPMGDGSFIMPLNKIIRKEINKVAGDQVILSIEIDNTVSVTFEPLNECLMNEPELYKKFYNLRKYHQNYFSNWIKNAKTTTTQVKRITMVLKALEQGLSFSEMLRQGKD